MSAFTKHQRHEIEELRRQIERLCEASRQRIAALEQEHDRRVTELLEANNREVERRREVERLLTMFLDAARVDALMSGPALMGWNRDDLRRAWQEARLRETQPLSQL